MSGVNSGRIGAALGARGSFRHKVLTAYRATRPFSFPCSVMPVLVATAAVLPIGRWHWDRLAAVLIAVLGLHIAANLFNDYFDYTGGVDTREAGDADRPGRMLVTGQVKPGQVRTGAVAALLAGALASVYLAWRVDAVVLAFYALGLAGGYAYTAPPIRMKARALGEFAMLAFFGFGIMSGVSYVQVQRIPTPVLLLAIPMGLAVSHILVGNNLRDLDEDAGGGVRTLAHLLGPRGMAALYWALALVCSLGTAAIGLAYGVPLLALSVLALATIPKPLRAVTRGERLPDIDARTARFNLTLGIIITAVLVYSGGIGVR